MVASNSITMESPAAVVNGCRQMIERLSPANRVKYFQAIGRALKYIGNSFFERNGSDISDELLSLWREFTPGHADECCLLWPTFSDRHLQDSFDFIQRVAQEDSPPIKRELDNRTVEQLAPDLQMLSAKQLASLMGISVRSVWRWIANGSLPKPLRIGSRCRRWRYADVKQFVEGRN